MKKTGIKVWMVCLLMAVLMAAAPQMDGNAAELLEKTKVTGLKVVSAKESSITLSWNPGKGASGYEILRYCGTEEKARVLIKINGGSTAQYTDRRLRSNSSYRYKIRAFVERKGIEVYGRYSSEIKADTLLRAPKVSAVPMKLKKQAALIWHKVPGAAGFEVYRADQRKGAYTRIASVSKNLLISRYTDKNLDRKNTYYYKRRAYKMDKNKKVYGAYSSVKKVKM